MVRFFFFAFKGQGEGNFLYLYYFAKCLFYEIIIYFYL